MADALYLLAPCSCGLLSRSAAMARDTMRMECGELRGNAFTLKFTYEEPEQKHAPWCDLLTKSVVSPAPPTTETT